MPTAKSSADRFLNLIAKIHVIKRVKRLHLLIFDDGSSHGTATIELGGNNEPMQWIKINLESVPCSRVTVEPRIINANLYGDSYKPAAGQISPSAKVIDACASCERFTINISRIEQIKTQLAVINIELIAEIIGGKYACK
jgi:hypothetical protein